MQPPILCRHIIASIDNEAAGPSYSVTSLSSSLRRNGVDSAVLTVGVRKSGEGLDIFGQDMTRLPVVSRLKFSSNLTNAINASAKQGAVLHSHGLWLMPNITPALAAKRFGAPLVVSPRGMLGTEALEFSSIRKKLVWAIAQRGALSLAKCFHATSEAESDDIRRMGLRSPIAVIPNGIDIPLGDPSTNSRTILHLGRIHPKKGIDQLISAWANIAKYYPDWKLRIVGPSEARYKETLERQVYNGLVPRVQFDDALYGEAKWQAYRDAGLFVLPTLNENFGMVVAEALAAGVPVICTKGAPWRGLDTKGCGWWVDHGQEPLATALGKALALPDVGRTDMGLRGREWMRSDFGWNAIANQMAELYLWCTGTGERPKCIATQS
jgi:glycosyltransferase involved in cell wall biosynthesis